jgi:anti-sigma factor RsiW
MTAHPHQALSAYADGELPEAEARRIEEHLERCTECVRELALLRSIGGAMRTMQTSRRGESLWEGVNRRIARPIGWVLLVAGAALWIALALVSWSREAITLEWLAGTALLVGVTMLAIGIAFEQYREWKDSPYKDIER